jgi:hypothetical protein
VRSIYPDELTRSTDRKTAAGSPTSLAIRDSRFAWRDKTSSSQSYARFLSTSFIFRRHSALHISQIGTCALRKQPHQIEDSSIIEARRPVAKSRATASKTKPATAFFVRPPRPRNPPRLHRLRHAWLASHHRAPSSSKSESPSNPVAGESITRYQSVSRR